MEQTRLEKIAAMVKKMPVEAVLITSPVNRQYATTFPSSAGACLVTEQGDGYFFTDFRYIEAAEKAAAPQGYQVQMVTGGDYMTPLAALLKKHQVKTLGYEDRRMSVSAYHQYEQALPCRLTPLGGRLEEVRQVKEEGEVECIVIARRMAEAAFEELLPMIRPGVTEKQLAAELNYRMLCHGAEGMSFDIIAVSGPNSSMPHGVPGERQVQKGDFITFDFGALYKGYHSDMTRTVAVGEASEEMRRVYDTVLRANVACCREMKAGCIGGDIHQLALDIISKEGYGEYFQHGLGHSVGLEIHEDPRASLNGTARLECGNVLTVEPGIYLPGKFGVRIEDMIWLSPDGPKNLTNTPKELLIL